MNSLDRLALALNVLEGDRPTRAILADWLLEAGQGKLADRVRRCRFRSLNRLELGILMLPTVAAIRLGSIFVAEGLYDEANAPSRKRALTPILQWSDGSGSPERFAEYRQRVEGLLPVMQGEQTLQNWQLLWQLRPLAKQSLEHLLLAVEHVCSAEFSKDHDEWDPEINKLICKVAQRSQRWYAVKVQLQSGLRRNDIVDDQLFRLIASYRSLLPDSQPWPK